MTREEISQQLLEFFKALADKNRLRLVGLLAQRAFAVEELALVLELQASTVSHHLAKLQAAGLVKASPDGHYHLYSLDFTALERRAKLLLSDKQLVQLAETTVEGDPFERKVMETFTDGQGRFKQLPKKRKKFEVLLRHTLSAFADEGPWLEKEVNLRLKQFSDDTAALRRGLVDHGLFQRAKDSSSYWLSPEGDKLVKR